MPPHRGQVVVKWSLSRARARREFWSATVYSLKTSSFFLNPTRLTLSSLDKELRVLT